MVGGRSCGFRPSQGADAALAAGRDGQVVRLGGEYPKTSVVGQNVSKPDKPNRAKRS